MVSCNSIFWNSMCILGNEDSFGHFILQITWIIENVCILTHNNCILDALFVFDAGFLWFGGIVLIYGREFCWKGAWRSDIPWDKHNHSWEDLSIFLLVSPVCQVLFSFFFLNFYTDAIFSFFRCLYLACLSKRWRIDFLLFDHEISQFRVKVSLYLLAYKILVHTKLGVFQEIIL